MKQRWVIKCGSSILSNPEGGLQATSVERIGRGLAALQHAGHEVILVTSGAIAAGVGRLGLKEKPKDLKLKQSAAAVGQMALMQAYQEVFSRYNVIPAQILLTRENLFHREQYLNIRNTLMTLLSLKTIPVINENDTVSTEEIKFGDNDTLSALIAMKVEADLLVLLSDVPGLYEFGFENALVKRIVPTVEKVTTEMERMASRQLGSKLSTGGIVTKLQAARMATAAGIETWLASGTEDGVLDRIAAQDPGAGTRFIPVKKKMDSRHAWIAYGRPTKGVLVIDAGAIKALADEKKSLLPKGVVSVKGNFCAGDTVVIKSHEGHEVGRGLINFNADEIFKIRGHHTKDIAALLGRPLITEVIHRDNLVVF